MSQLIVRVLGPPSLEYEGEYLAIPRRKVRALFYRLALDLQPVAREHLTYLLWANEPDTVGHRDLTHLITHLRNALPCEHILQCTADFLFLDARRVWCDATAILCLLRAYHAAPSRELLLEAASLVRGPLLEGFLLDDCPEFEEWLTIERSVWEHRHRVVLEALARICGDDLGLLLLQPSEPSPEEAAGEGDARSQAEVSGSLVDLPHFAPADHVHSL